MDPLKEKVEQLPSYTLFDSTEHLLFHLPYEALLGRLVQYKWEYPFERW